MTTKYVFKALLDILAEDSDMSDPLSMINIVGAPAFARDKFIQVSDPRTDVTGLFPSHDKLHWVWVTFPS